MRTYAHVYAPIDVCSNWRYWLQAQAAKPTKRSPKFDIPLFHILRKSAIPQLRVFGFLTPHFPPCEPNAPICDEKRVFSRLSGSISANWGKMCESPGYLRAIRPGNTISQEYPKYIPRISQN